MTNNATWPLMVRGKRTLLSARVERDNLTGIHHVWVGFGPRRIAGDLEVPADGVQIPVDFDGFRVTVIVGPAQGHLLALAIG